MFPEGANPWHGARRTPAACVRNYAPRAGRLGVIVPAAVPRRSNSRRALVGAARCLSDRFTWPAHRCLGQWIGAIQRAVQSAVVILLDERATPVRAVGANDQKQPWAVAASLNARSTCRRSSVRRTVTFRRRDLVGTPCPRGLGRCLVLSSDGCVGSLGAWGGGRAD